MNTNKSTVVPLSPPDQRGSSKQRNLSSIPTHPLKRITFFLATLAAVFLLLQIRSLKHPPRPTLHRRVEEIVTFLPLKNQSLSAAALAGNTWFMSTLNDTPPVVGEEAEHLHFPSEASKGKLLCLAGNDTSDGKKNSYALASPGNLPANATLLKGLTVVSDTYYDYGNLWHGLAAVVPVAGWQLSRIRRGGKCTAAAPTPERWVLYHWGELRTHMGGWVKNIVEVTFGKEVVIEGFERGGERPTCFEEAVVFRRNEGKMSMERKGEAYDMFRCSARAFCGVRGGEGGDGGDVRMTLLLRVGARSFKNDSAVIDVFRRACEKVDGCRLTVAWPNNLTFCDQVRLLSSTDVVATPHGAQLTNMIFMDRNSSVMEFYPKGWQDLAGSGQYVFRWLAGYAGIRHEGSWWDPHGDGRPCPFPAEEMEGGATRCFTQFYKDGRLGHDEAHFTQWSGEVLRRAKEHKLLADGAAAAGESTGTTGRRNPSACGPCG